MNIQMINPQQTAWGHGTALSNAPATSLAEGDASPFVAGLSAAGLHEIYAAHGVDAAALTGCGLMLAASLRASKASILWVRHAGFDRETGMPEPNGLAHLGLAPEEVLLLRARDAAMALQAGLEGARCAALGAVILELWGEATLYDLTASRRLALAARAAGVPLLLLRAAAKPAPSAAETRWRLRAMPSRPLPARAPGHPALELTLLRARNGREGAQHHLEWNRDARRFIALAATADSTTPRQPPLSGTVVALPAHGSGAAHAGTQPLRRAG